MGSTALRGVYSLFTSKRSFSRRALTTALIVSIILGIAAVPAFALSSTQFELDGNAVKSAHDDWNNVIAGTGNDINHVFIADGQSGDTTYFDKGGSKDIHPISSWLSGGPGAPDKDEILDAYAAAYANGTFYFGADRYANNGDSVIGFWFFQNKIGLNGVNFTGTHKVGDVLVVADFPGGVGTIGDIKVYKWNGSGITDVTPAGGADCSTALAGPVCAITNQGPETAPWPFTPKKGPSGTFPAGSFFEGGIDFSQFFDQVPCFSSFMAETRTSHSVDARLKDFALGDLSNCGSVSGTKYNDLNVSGGRNQGEPGLENWSIHLFGGSVDLTTTTDSNGNYEFDAVPPGTYTICETIKAGWFQSQPSSGADCSQHGGGHGYAVEVGLGDKITGKLFGNYQRPNLAILKTPDSATVSAGTDIGFKIKVTNNGPGQANNITVTDPLPSQGSNGISWTVADDGGATCGITTGTLTCTKATLAAGDSFTVHVTSHTNAESCGTYENTATVSAPQNDGSPQSSTSTQVLCAHIVIQKVADDSSVNAGHDIGFKITVTNSGEGTATGVTMTDTLPTDPGLSWTVADDGGASCGISAGVLTCTEASLAAGDHFTVHITSPTTRETCGVVENTASVTTTNDGNDKDGATVEVLCPRLQIEKVADDPTVNAGDQIGFKITTTNFGDGTAFNVIVKDTLPTNGGLDWTVADDGGANCNISSGVLTCTKSSLASGAHFTIHITSPTTADTCGTVTNTAAVFQGEQDLEVAALQVLEPIDTSTASVNVNCPPLSIEIEKGGPSVAHIGDTITYTFTVTNGTEQPLHNITVTDPLCASTPEYQSGDTNSDTILQQGETWIFTCTHIVTISDPDPLPNTATATGTDKLGRETSDEDSHSVDILHPSIEIEKSANPKTGNPGDTVTYTFVVTNTSSDTTLFNISVDDDKLGHIGDISSLAPGQSATLTKTTTLPTSGGDLVNVGTATGTDVGGKKVTDTDNATVTVVLAIPPIAKTGTNSSGIGLIGIVFLATGIAMATRKERGRVRPAFSTSVSARAILLEAHRRSWRTHRKLFATTRARLRWRRRTQGPSMREGP